MGAKYAHPRQSILERSVGECYTHTTHIKAGAHGAPFFVAINSKLSDLPPHPQLIVAAVLALVLVQFRRQPRQKLREHCYTFLRLNSTTLSLLATVVAFAAFLFASLHLDNVTSKETVCMPADVFSSSNAVCICLFGSSGAAAQANATAAVRPLDGGGLTADGLEFQYR